VLDSCYEIGGTTTVVITRYSREIPFFKGFYLSAFSFLNVLIQVDQMVIPLYQLKMTRKLAMKNCTCNDRNYLLKPGVVCLFATNPKQQIA
jgi:hypothetical protein